MRLGPARRPPTTAVRRRYGRNSTRRPRHAASTLIEDVLEPEFAAVVRVGHVEVAPEPGGVDRAQQGGITVLCAGRRDDTQRPRVLHVGTPGSGRSPRSPRRSPGARCPRGRCRGREAAAVARRSGRIPACQARVQALSTSISPVEALLGQEVGRLVALGGGGSADVPHADEQDAHRPQSTPHRSGTRSVGLPDETNPPPGGPGHRARRHPRQGTADARTAIRVGIGDQQVFDVRPAALPAPRSSSASGTSSRGTR